MGRYLNVIRGFVFCFAMTLRLHAAIEYTFTDLGPGTRAFGLNNSGQVVGESAPPEHAFLYSNGSMTDLGTLGGNFLSGAVAINDSSQVVGFSTTSNLTLHAFIHADGMMTNLGTLGGTTSLARDINSSGVIVGWSGISNNIAVMHAFVYSNGLMSDLGTLGGSNSEAVAINSAGQIAGVSDASNGVRHIFLFSQGHMINLSTTNASIVSVGDMNDSGWMTGSAIGVGGFTNAFLYKDGQLIELGSLGGYSSGFSINSLGQITGTSATNNVFEFGDRFHAFIYSGGMMRDLNDLVGLSPEWVLESGQAINDKGQIAGWGHSNDQFHAFLLTPVPRLQIMVAGTNQVALSWTTNFADGFGLEASQQPGSINWNAISNQPAGFNGQYHVTNEIAGEQRFFRLRRP